MRLLSKIAIVLLVLFPSLCLAAPFLICDPYPSSVTQPTFFKVSIDGGAEVDSLPQTVTGGVILHYDVGNVSVGVHSWTVRACIETDEWGGGGCSATSPFSSTRHEVGSGPSVPTGLRLSAQ